MAGLGAAALAARRLPASTWGEAEAGAFTVLRGLAPMWVTGGWVRDKLLESSDANRRAGEAWARLRRLAGYPPGDLDVLVDSVTARDFHSACMGNTPLRTALLGPPVLVEARGSRTIDTVKLRLPHHNVDVTSILDVQQLYGDPAEPRESTQAALRGDAEHRDTTFNSCYYDLTSEEVLDPTGWGLRDLAEGTVRVPHSEGVVASLREDPVRLLRIFRFAARFGFELASELEDELESAGDLAELLRRTAPGRLLYELKKALLLHNRPSRFLDLLGAPYEVHKLLFSGAGDGVLNAWPAAVGRVRRLEALVTEGLERGALTSRSCQWRGRRPDSAPPALMAPDWRKTGVYENDWAELLLAALLWRSDGEGLRRVCGKLQLSTVMAENIERMQVLSRQKLITAQTAPPAVHLLNAAVLSAEQPAAFWNRWPCPPARQEE